jgi:hypothetical protein
MFRRVARGAWREACGARACVHACHASSAKITVSLTRVCLPPVAPGGSAACCAPSAPAPPQLFDHGRAMAQQGHVRGQTAIFDAGRSIIVVVPCSAEDMAAVDEIDALHVMDTYGLQRDGGGAAQRTRFVVVPKLDFSVLEHNRREEARAAGVKRAAKAAKVAALAAPAEAPDTSCASQPQLAAVATAASAAVVFARAGSLAMLPPTHAVMRRGSFAA